MAELEYEVRKFEVNDLKNVRLIEAKSFPEPLSEIAFLFLSEACDFYVASLKEMIIGYIIVGYEDNETLHIFHIAASENWRRKKVATELVRVALDKLTHKRCRTLVREKNTTARQFWRALGFEEEAILKNHFPRGENGIILTKTA